jgi:hypothetical protein
MTAVEHTFSTAGDPPPDPLAIAVAGIAAWLARQTVEVVFRVRPKETS